MVVFRRSNKIGWKLLSPLGEGLNSSVFKALRRSSPDLPDQIVAVKIFKSLDDVRIFENRFNDLAKVRSNYCVGLLGWEKVDGQTAVIMDFIDGMTLESLTKQCVLAPELKHEIAAQLFNGLNELHSLSQVHGDLSPSNIMIDRSGRVKLVDYGLNEEASVGETVGTPKYLSAERWGGKKPSLESDRTALEMIVQDLLDDTINSKMDVSESRSRAEQFFAAFDSFDFIETVGAKNELAKKVTEATRLSKKDSSTKTTVLKGNQRLSLVSNRLAKIAAVAMVLLGFFGPVEKAGGLPLKGLIESADRRGGSLEFRTIEWYEIEINGEKLGVTPLSTIRLQPGAYLIRWRNQSGSGLVKVRVEANKSLILNDAQLKTKDHLFSGT